MTMWLAPLLTSGAAALGRLVTVTLLPTAMLTLFVWLVIHSDAFDRDTAGLMLADLMRFEVTTEGIVALVVLIIVLSVATQPFQILAVRALEGYLVPRGLAGLPLRAAQRRHRARLQWCLIHKDDDDWALEEELLDAVSLELLPVDEQARRRREFRARQRRADRARALWELYPPNEADVLPTMLGNALRSSERRSGERYHLSTVHALPRLNACLSDRLATTYNSAVDTLDAAAMMTIGTGLMTASSLFAFIDDPALYWIPVLLLVACLASYRGALVTAVSYGVLLDVAFDAHRFDLRRSLHLRLPADADEERTQNKELTAFWEEHDVTKARRRWARVRYWHHDDQAALDASDDQPANTTGYL
jgi:hypothetical protein